MTYQQAITYLESFINYERVSRWSYKRSLKLERLRDFLSSIGNPQDGLLTVHVAGSKGKGSTCAYIAYILRAAGFSTGLYTSPHLVSFRERIRILKPSALIGGDFEGMISRQQLVGIIERLAPAIKKFSGKSPHGALSFFEVYTAIAFEYFRRAHVDCVVLETGMGGRLDATNVVSSLVQVITPVSYEHMDKLGTTLAAIAKEKAGIIKQGSIVVSASQKREALNVIDATCRRLGSRLWRLGKEISVSSQGENKFSVFAGKYAYTCLQIRLQGKHQIENAAVAVAGVEALRRHGVLISRSAVKKGLAATTWPGRCEIVSRKPCILLDGAHNSASAACLRQTLKEYSHYRRKILILGVSDDKDITGICKQLVPLMRVIILTRSRNPRAATLVRMERQIKKIKITGLGIIKTDSVRQAKKVALRIAHSQDMIIVTGSLFVVGEFRHEIM